MKKKENERDHISDLLSRLRQSVGSADSAESAKTSPQDGASDSMRADDSFDQELSDRLEKHLRTEDADAAASVQDDETDFDVSELEIVADGALDLAQTEELTEGDTYTEAEEEAILSNLDALLAHMTPEQRALFEAEMSAMDEEETVDGTPPDEPSFTEETESDEQDADDALPVGANEAEIAEADDAEAALQEDDDTLSEAEALHALKARMTPEQLAQFEQVLREVQETDSEEQITVGEAAENAEENDEEEDGIWIFGDVSVQNAVRETISSEQEASTEETVQVRLDDGVSDNNTAEQINTDPPAAALDMKGSSGEEDTVTAPPAVPPSEPADFITVISNPTADTADIAEDSSIFLAAESDEEMESMPTIRVGMEPSAFALAEDPEWQPESEEDEAKVIAFLSGLTPEQLARFRAQLAAEEGEETVEETEVDLSHTEERVQTAEVPASAETGEVEVSADNPAAREAETEVDDEHNAATESAADVTDAGTAAADDGDMAENDAPAEDALIASAAVSPQVIEEEPEVVPIAPDLGEGAFADAAAVSAEEAAESVTEEERSEADSDDPIAALWNDPDRLEELKARLTPEQAAELERVLREESDAAADGTEESAAEGDPAVQEEQPTVLWTAPAEGGNEAAPMGELAEIPTEKAFSDPHADESVESVQADSDDTEEEEFALAEISEDMTDEDISLKLELGFEPELIRVLGKARVERVKKNNAREEVRDPAFADAYAYEGKEYRRREQAAAIKHKYHTEKRRVWFRLAGTSVFTLLLFLYECCGVFRGAFGGALDPAHYPVIAIMAGWQLLIFAAAFSWKQMLHGVRSAFMLDPDKHSMTAVIVAAVMLNNILLSFVFKGSTLFTYNFPAALSLLCLVLCDLADVCREEMTFEIVSSPNNQYVAEAVTLHGDKTEMPPLQDEMDMELPQTPKNAMYVRRAGFVRNYFRRTNRKTGYRHILNFVFLPLLAFSVVMGIMTALTGNDITAALGSFSISLLLCMPLSYTVFHSFPQYYETRRLHRQGCAIVGESAVEEYNTYSTVVFEDKELFPPTLIKTKGLKLYENNQIYYVILKISLLFREIGGPINDVLDLDKEEMQRFLRSGKGMSLAGCTVMLERVTDEGVLAGMSDGSRVVAGSVDFLRSHGIHVTPNAKDRQLLESGDMSILYLAFDNKLSARFYVDYRPDSEFEVLAGFLQEEDFRVAVRTLDPGICDHMIRHKCANKASATHTIRAAVGELTERPEPAAKVDSGLVCLDDPRKMLLPLRSIRRLRRLYRLGLRLSAIVLFVNVLVTIILAAFNITVYMTSLSVSLYMLVWLIFSLVLSQLFLNK